MASGFVIRKNEYYDSVFLMRIARILNDEPGVLQSAVLMATEANKQLLADIQVRGEAIDQASPNDLIAAVISQDTGVVERVLGSLETRLKSIAAPARANRFRSLADAAAAHPQANLAVITVPGDYAGREARLALEHGQHVFCFSNNVPLVEEIQLKQLAREKGLLVMGPDCGTSILNGVGVGFANIVRRGAVGAVGPSGTGLQEFTSLVDQAGAGISHAIGTGSRDLTDAVGGITTLMGLEALEADPATRVIAIISKPAGPETLQRLLDWIRTSSKPVVACFLGLDKALPTIGEHFFQAGTIDEAVHLALACLGQAPPPAGDEDVRWLGLIAAEAAQWSPQQRYLRGLFAGGTFCYQSQQILRQAGIPVYSNSPLDKRYLLANPQRSLEHSLVDLGDDVFTRGKPHPMIDAGERRKHILAEAADPETAVLLLDFVLGYIAAPDPVGDLIAAIRQARQSAESRGGHLTVVASICGTQADPQNYTRQKQMLAGAGVLVFSSNARAARFCAELFGHAWGGNRGK